MMHLISWTFVLITIDGNIDAKPHNRIYRIKTPHTTETVPQSEDSQLPLPTTSDDHNYREIPPHRSGDQTAPVVTSRGFVFRVNGTASDVYIPGHHIVINDPHRTVSVLEPSGGGCAAESVATVRETARNAQCLIAVNAGFFNCTPGGIGGCFGAVISDGKFTHDPMGVPNAHFGVKQDGHLFFGYLPPGIELKESFDQLIGGFLWLVRDGKNYVDIAAQTEKEGSFVTAKETDYFINFLSGRLAVGHDSEGRLVIVSVDGRTLERGLHVGVPVC